MTRPPGSCRARDPARDATSAPRPVRDVAGPPAGLGLTLNPKPARRPARVSTRPRPDPRPRRRQPPGFSRPTRDPFPATPSASSPPRADNAAVVPRAPTRSQGVALRPQRRATRGEAHGASHPRRQTHRLPPRPRRKIGDPRGRGWRRRSARASAGWTARRTRASGRPHRGGDPRPRAASARDDPRPAAGRGATIRMVGATSWRIGWRIGARRRDGRGRDAAAAVLRRRRGGGARDAPGPRGTRWTRRRADDPRAPTARRGLRRPHPHAGSPRQAATARAATAKNSLGVLQGHRATFQITRRETVLGRSTEDQKVDVDLAEEGNAWAVSRQHAFVKLRWNGEFVLRNVGKRHVWINNVAVESGRRASPRAALAHRGWRPPADVPAQPRNRRTPSPSRFDVQVRWTKFRHTRGRFDSGSFETRERRELGARDARTKSPSPRPAPPSRVLTVSSILLVRVSVCLKRNRKRPGPPGTRHAALYVKSHHL